jgi:hypothetical protein
MTLKIETFARRGRTGEQIGVRGFSLMLRSVRKEDLGRWSSRQLKGACAKSEHSDSFVSRSGGGSNVHRNSRLPVRSLNSRLLFRLQTSQVVIYRRNSVWADAPSPNWHFIIAMRSESLSSVNDSVKHVTWKHSSIVLREQRQIRRARPKGFSNWPAPFAIDSMA